MSPAIRRDSFYAVRFWDNVDQSGECWLWTRSKNADGYGVAHVRVAGEVLRSAHRAAYTLAVGPIPEGLHIDHLCRTRACVRPDHLEAVTPAENNRRIPRDIAGRPRKAAEDRYRTPVRTIRVPDVLWMMAKHKAAMNNLTVTDVLNRALDEFLSDDWKDWR